MSQNITEFNYETFSTSLKKNELPVLVDFWAPWCVPCRSLSPIIEKIHNTTSEELKVAKINVDEYPDVMKQLGIRGIPTLILFKNEQEISRKVGTQSFNQLSAWLAEHGVAITTGADDKLAQENSSWPAFYGDESLQNFLFNRLTNLASNGKLKSSHSPYWTAGEGSFIGALVLHENPEIFSRITGISVSTGRVIERVSIVAPEEVASLKKHLAPGKNFSTLPLRFMAYFLSDEYVTWSSHLNCPLLKKCLADWLHLYSKTTGINYDLTSEWKQLKNDVTALESKYDAPEFTAESLITELLIELSPPPADSNNESWELIMSNFFWVTIQLIQILDGWSVDERAKGHYRDDWFRTKTDGYEENELTDELLTSLRDQWSAENPGFIEKEIAFHSNIPALLAPLEKKLQQALFRLMDESPVFASY